MLLRPHNLPTGIPTTVSILSTLLLLSACGNFSSYRGATKGRPAKDPGTEQDASGISPKSNPGGSPAADAAVSTGTAQTGAGTTNTPQEPSTSGSSDALISGGTGGTDWSAGPSVMPASSNAPAQASSPASESASLATGSANQASGSTTAAANPGAVSLAAPSVESRPSTTCAFSVVVNFGVFLVPGVVRAARTVQFAPDASAFNVTITALVINDNSPFLNINGVVIPMPLEHPDFPAHTLPLAISISSALRGGDNAFEGSFFNRFGAEGGMQIALAGSYSTREGCAGPVVR